MAGLGVAARGALDLIRPLAMPLAAITVGDVSESFLKVDPRLSHISHKGGTKRRLRLELPSY